jgi:hypothetical protein
MSQDRVQFDEWHIQWWLQDELPKDVEQLRKELNSQSVLTAIEDAIQELVRRTPALNLLTVTVSR